MGTKLIDYSGWSIIRLLETLWQEYGKQVHFDGKGRLMIVCRTYPPVPPDLALAIQKRNGQVRQMMALEAQEKPVETLLAGGDGE